MNVVLVQLPSNLSLDLSMQPERLRPRIVRQSGWNCELRSIELEPPNEDIGGRLETVEMVLLHWGTTPELEWRRDVLSACLEVCPVVVFSRSRIAQDFSTLEGDARFQANPRLVAIQDVVGESYNEDVVRVVAGRPSIVGTLSLCGAPTIGHLAVNQTRQWLQSNLPVEKQPKSDADYARMGSDLADLLLELYPLEAAQYSEVARRLG